MSCASSSPSNTTTTVIERIRQLATLRPRRLGAASALVLTVVSYLIFAPSACGDPMTYARVAGSSMTPRMQPGDLVIARKTDDYQLGEVVAYHNPDLGLVMHRVIVDNRDRVIVKGDANTWVDSYQPRKSEIVGKLWLRIPNGASLLAWLKPPWATLGFTALAMIAFAYPLLRKRGGTRALRPRLKAWNRWDHSGWEGKRAWLLAQRERLEPVLTVYAPFGSIVALGSIVVAVLALLLMSLSYGRAPLRLTTEEHAYTQRAHFRYEADAPPGLYDTSTIREGDPVFLKLTRSVLMGVDVDLDGERLERPTGTVALTATLRQQNGWERTVVLAPQREFTGTHAAATGTLDLGALRRIVDDTENATGVHFESYQLVVHASVQSTTDGTRLRPFEPEVVFRISPTQLQIEQTVSGERSPLTHLANGALTSTRSEVSQLSLGPWSPTVARVRFWSPIALLGSLAALVLLGRTTVKAMAGTEADRIEAQYAGLILRADMLPLPSDMTLVALRSFEDLARMARTAGLPVFQRADSPPDYVLLTPEAAYHYVADDHEQPSAITRRIAQRLRGQAA